MKNMEPEQVIYCLVEAYLKKMYPGIDSTACLVEIVSEAGVEDDVLLYNIKILDENENEDRSHKEIPSVPSNTALKFGDKAVAIFLYRDFGRAYLVGKHP